MNILKLASDLSILLKTFWKVFLVDIKPVILVEQSRAQSPRTFRRWVSRCSTHPAALSAWPSEEVSQFILGSFKSSSLPGRKLPASPIDVKRKHRHRRTKWIALAAPAALGRALERIGDLPRVVEREYTRLEIQGVAGFGYVLGPSFALGVVHGDIKSILSKI